MHLLCLWRHSTYLRLARVYKLYKLLYQNNGACTSSLPTWVIYRMKKLDLDDVNDLKECTISKCGIINVEKADEERHWNTDFQFHRKYRRTPKLKLIKAYFSMSIARKLRVGSLLHKPQVHGRLTARRCNSASVSHHRLIGTRRYAVWLIPVFGWNTAYVHSRMHGLRNYIAPF